MLETFKGNDCASNRESGDEILQELQSPKPAVTPKQIIDFFRSVRQALEASGGLIFTLQKIEGLDDVPIRSLNDGQVKDILSIVAKQFFRPENSNHREVFFDVLQEAVDSNSATFFLEKRN